MPYYSEPAYFWYQVKKVSIVPARSTKSCSVQAVRQVVSTDVLIVGRLDGDGQSFVPIGLHKIDAASDWLLKKTALHWYEWLAGSSVTKLIRLQQLSA